MSVVVVSSTFDDTLSLSFSARERTPIIYINKVFTFRERKSLDPKPPGNVEYSRLWPNEVPRDGPRACRTQPRDRSSPHFVYVSIDDGVSTNRWSLLLRRRREVVRCRAPDAREKEEAEDVRAVAQRPRENRGFERLVDRRHVRWRRRLCVCSMLQYSMVLLERMKVSRESISNSILFPRGSREREAFGCAVHIE